MRFDDLLEKFKDRNIYDELSVQQNADMKTIMTAYRKLALSFHPDKNKSDKQALAKFHDLLYIIEILENAETRKIYDKQLEKRKVNKNDMQDGLKRKEKVGEMKRKLAEEIKRKKESEKRKAEEQLKARKSRVKEEQFRNEYIRRITSNTLVKNSHKEAVTKVEHLDLEQLIDNVIEHFTDYIAKKFSESTVPEVKTDDDYEEWCNIFWQFKSLAKKLINDRHKTEMINTALEAATVKIENDCFYQNKQCAEKTIEDELVKAFDNIKIDIHDKEKTPENVIIYLIKSADLGYQIACKKGKKSQEISNNYSSKIEKVMSEAVDKYITDARDIIVSQVSKRLEVITVI